MICWKDSLVIRAVSVCSLFAVEYSRVFLLLTLFTRRYLSHFQQELKRCTLMAQRPTCDPPIQFPYWRRGGTSLHGVYTQIRLNEPLWVLRRERLSNQIMKLCPDSDLHPYLFVSSVVSDIQPRPFSAPTFSSESQKSKDLFWKSDLSRLDRWQLTAGPSLSPVTRPQQTRFRFLDEWQNFTWLLFCFCEWVLQLWVRRAAVSCMTNLLSVKHLAVKLQFHTFFIFFWLSPVEHVSDKS